MSSIEEEADVGEEEQSPPANAGASKWGWGIFAKSRPAAAESALREAPAKKGKAVEKGRKGKVVQLDAGARAKEKQKLQAKQRAECVCSYCHGLDGNELNGGKPHNKTSCAVRLAGMPPCKCPVVEHGGCGDHSRKHDFTDPELRCQECFEELPATIRSIDTSYQQFMTKWEGILLDLQLVACEEDEAPEAELNAAMLQTGHLWKDHKDNSQNLKRGLKTWSGEHFRIIKNTHSVEELEALTPDQLFALARDNFSPCSGPEEGQRGRIDLQLLDLIHMVLSRQRALKERRPLLSSEDLKETRLKQDNAVDQARMRAQAGAEKVAELLREDGAGMTHDEAGARGSAGGDHAYGRAQTSTGGVNLKETKSHDEKKVAPSDERAQKTKVAELVGSATKSVLLDDHQCSEVLSLGLHRLLRLRISQINLDDQEQAEALLEAFMSPEMDVRRSELSCLVTERCPELFTTSPALADLQKKVHCTRSLLCAATETLAVKEDEVRTLRDKLAMAEEAAKVSRHQVAQAEAELDEALQRLSTEHSTIVAQALLRPLPAPAAVAARPRDWTSYAPPTTDKPEMSSLVPPSKSSEGSAHRGFRHPNVTHPLNPGSAPQPPASNPFAGFAEGRFSQAHNLSAQPLPPNSSQAHYPVPHPRPLPNPPESLAQEETCQPRVPFFEDVLGGAAWRSSSQQPSPKLQMPPAEGPSRHAFPRPEFRPSVAPQNCPNDHVTGVRPEQVVEAPRYGPTQTGPGIPRQAVPAPSDVAEDSGPGTRFSRPLSAPSALNGQAGVKRKSAEPSKELTGSEKPHRGKRAGKPKKRQRRAAGRNVDQEQREEARPEAESIRSVGQGRGSAEEGASRATTVLGSGEVEAAGATATRAAEAEARTAGAPAAGATPAKAMHAEATDARDASAPAVGVPTEGQSQEGREPAAPARTAAAAQTGGFTDLTYSLFYQTSGKTIFWSTFAAPE